MLDQLSQTSLPAPCILPNFLPVQTCQKISTWAAESNRWEDALPPWNQRSINLESMDGHIRSCLLDIFTDVKAKLRDYWHNTNPLYGDIFQIVRWQPGDKLEPPHADAEHINGDPHPFAYREYAAIIYLNQDYTGGQIYFPGFRMIPEISTGTLAIFPGTLDYLHGVTPVRSGTRYTIAGFLTSQQSYGNQYLI